MNNIKMENQNRIIYLDLLRIFATFAVVMIHISASNWDFGEVSDFQWITFTIYDVLVQFAVPVFLMISGVVFLNPKKKIETKKIYTKYIFRLGVAYTFWSIVYNTYRFIVQYINEGSYMTAKEIVRGLIRANYHMTFILVIAGIYIIVPMLRKIVEDRKLMKYFLICSFLFVNIPYLLPIIPKYITTELYIIFQEMHLGFLGGFVAYFVLGYYLNNVEVSKKSRYCIYVLMVLSRVFTVMVTHTLSMEDGVANTEWLGYLLPTTYIAVCGVFLFFKYELSRIKFSDKMIKVIMHLSKMSFGIYLVHVIVISIIVENGISTLYFNPILSVPVISLLVMLISYLVVLIISKIPVLNKYII